MKRVLTTITIALLFIASANAQQFYVGAGGSFLNTWMTNQNNYGLPFEMDYVPKFGVAGNISLGYDFNNNIGVKLEAGYGVLGQKYKDNYQDTTYTRTVQLNYIQIPVLFKYRSGGDVTKFYMLVGPQFNILMSAKQDYYKNETLYSNYYNNPITNTPILIGEETITERFASLDIMGRFDVGVDIVFTPNLFMNLGATFAYGFMDVNATDWQIPDHSSGTYNPSHNFYGGFNFGIHYVIPMGGK